MGSFSSKQTQKSTYTPSAQQLGAANTLTDAYNAAKPVTEQITGQLGSLIPGLTATATAANTAATGAAGYYGDVLGGKYIAGNPFVDGIINSTSNDVTDRVGSQFSAAGRYGSNSNAYVLAKALAESENNLRYTNYNNERARMDAAASGAGSLNSSVLGSALGLGTTIAGLPLQQAAQYSSGIGSLGIGGTTTGTVTQNQGLGSLLGGVIGSGLAGWASGGFKGI